jgi:hypothetical protein
MKKGFALIEKTISQQFQGSDIYIFIAGIQRSDNKKTGPLLTLPIG